MVSVGKLLEYVVPLKKIIFFRLMKQLSEVYANMTIENFERAVRHVLCSLLCKSNISGCLTFFLEKRCCNNVLFTKASIVPFSLAEKWMANAAKDQGINIQINYSQEAIVFGAPRKVASRLV